MPAPTRISLGFAQRPAALQIDDPSLAKRDQLEALLASAVAPDPGGRADDHVPADLPERWLHLDPLVAAFLDLKLQDLTGLVGSASGGRLLPPEVTVRDATPLGVVCEERGEGCWIAVVERFGGGP